MRRGYTIIELMTVIGIMVLIGAILLPNLRGNRAGKELTSAVQESVALLREAQGRAISESSSTSWGVRFDNTVTSTPFFALFGGTYGTTTTVTRALLPSRVRYATSSVAQGSSTEVLFVQGTGRVATGTSIRFELIEGTSGNVTSTTVTVNTFGAVSF